MTRLSAKSRIGHLPRNEVECFEVFGLGLERQKSFEALAGGEGAHFLPQREKRRGLFLGGRWTLAQAEL